MLLFIIGSSLLHDNWRQTYAFHSNWHVDAWHFLSILFLLNFPNNFFFLLFSPHHRKDIWNVGIINMSTIPRWSHKQSMFVVVANCIESINKSINCVVYRAIVWNWPKSTHFERNITIIQKWTQSPEQGPEFERTICVYDQVASRNG